MITLSRNIVVASWLMCLFPCNTVQFIRFLLVGCELPAAIKLSSERGLKMWGYYVLLFAQIPILQTLVPDRVPVMRR